MTHDNVTDIVERLRSYPAGDGDTLAAGYVCMMMEDAANEIISLRKQLENARSEALEEAAVMVGAYSDTQCGEGMVISAMRDAAKAFATAIRALKGQPC